jgi:pyruvate dehydrogenase E1 component alpha subunit
LGELGLGDEARRIVDAARAEVDAALAAAESAPLPEAARAYTDVLDTGAGRWM